MERVGIVRKLKSPWSSPLHIDPKQSGDWRLCGDYHRLNDITIPDRYPVPHIHDSSNQLSGKNISSKIDILLEDIIKFLLQLLTFLRQR